MAIKVNKFVRTIMGISFCFTSANAQTPNQQLIIFHAGSLAVPFEKIINGFKEENHGVVVLKEIAGSRECARKITDLNKSCDIMASADYTVIDQLLIPTYADWNLKFATNEMTIVFTTKSRRSAEMNQNNWHNLLLDPSVRIGRADPSADPCGYRTVITMKLAEKYYNNKGLAERILKKDNEYIRPKEVDLLALLEAGEIDYVFLYRSVAEQHGLKFQILPDSINLKNTELENYYGKVNVELSGKKPGEKFSQAGTSMVYSVTIPKNSPNPEIAKKFIHYLMNQEKGLKIMSEMGQPTVVPSPCATFDKLPKDLQQYATKE